MKKVRVGVLCPSEIAIRRFMPSLSKIDEVEFVGVGVASPEERESSDLQCSELKEMNNRSREKAQGFIVKYGGRIFDSYYSIATSDDIDAIYIPLPPALHYKWAKVALEAGKHVLVEKPSTIDSHDTKELISAATQKELSLFENYMFVYHNQLKKIREIIKAEEIGDIRLLSMRFGFPKRPATDFRYDKKLGGGALIDAGGYVIRAATWFLGETAKIEYARMNYIDEADVDMYGSAALSNNDGITAQVSFGMDNDYKCELEVWGSKGTLSTGRFFTAPEGFSPKAIISKNGKTSEIDLPADDAFGQSIKEFLMGIEDSESRISNYRNMQIQADLVEDFRRKAMNK